MSDVLILKNIFWIGIAAWVVIAGVIVLTYQFYEGCRRAFIRLNRSKPKKSIWEKDGIRLSVSQRRDSLGKYHYFITGRGSDAWSFVMSPAKPSFFSVLSSTHRSTGFSDFDPYVFVSSPNRTEVGRWLTEEIVRDIILRLFKLGCRRIATLDGQLYIVISSNEDLEPQIDDIRTNCIHLSDTIIEVWTPEKVNQRLRSFNTLFKAILWRPDNWELHFAGVVFIICLGSLLLALHELTFVFHPFAPLQHAFFLAIASLPVLILFARRLFSQFLLNGALVSFLMISSLFAEFNLNVASVILFNRRASVASISRTIATETVKPTGIGQVVRFNLRENPNIQKATVPSNSSPFLYLKKGVLGYEWLETKEGKPARIFFENL